MKKHIMNMLIGLIVLSSHAFAGPGGDGVGNGGDVITCRNATGAISTIELLDFYEARSLRDIHHDLGDTALSVEDKIMIALNRMRVFAPEWAAQYEREVRDFYANSNFQADVTLVDVPDSQHLALPVGCAIEQIVIQREPRFAEDKRYLVNKNLWDALDNSNKAALILHEITYRHALTWNHTSSIPTRYFNSYITSRRLDGATADQFVKLMTELRFMPGVEVRGVRLDLARGKVEFHPNGVVASAPAAAGALAPIASRSIPVKGVVKWHDNTMLGGVTLVDKTLLPINGTEALVYAELNFHPNGATALAHLVHDATFYAGKFSLPIRGNRETSSRHTGKVTFHDNGSLSEGFLTENRQLVTPYYELGIGGLARFHQNGVLKDGWLEGCARIRLQGKWLKLAVDNCEGKTYSGSYVPAMFHENGLPADVRIDAWERQTIDFRGQSVELTGGKLKLLENGTIWTVPTKNYIPVRSRETTFLVRGEIEVTETGELVSATDLDVSRSYSYLAGGQWVTIWGQTAYFRDGQVRDEDNRTAIRFHANGALYIALLASSATFTDARSGERVETAACTKIELDQDGKLIGRVSIDRYHCKRPEPEAPRPPRRGD